MKYGWNLDDLAWERAQERLIVLQWRRVLLVEVQATLVPESSGVYLICATPPLKREGASEKPLANFYNALYAGQSKSLRERFKTHSRISSPDIEQAKKTFKVLDYWYALVDIIDLNFVESLLLDVLGPTANRINAPLQGTLGNPEPANSRTFSRDG
jgi:hypothetical protein